MTHSNVKKVVQFNLNLNSKILSKSTNEIVNTCVGKLYKQMPTTHKLSLKKAAEAAKKFETEVACKQMKEDQYRAKANLYASEICYQMKLRKKPFPCITKKMQRAATTTTNTTTTATTTNTTTSDICCPKSYGSSARNTNPWEKYRSTYVYPSLTDDHLNRNTLSEQFANSVHSIERAVEVTGKMHHDLIAIDKLLKNCLKVTEISTDTPAIEEPVYENYPTRNRSSYTVSDNYIPRASRSKTHFSNPMTNNGSSRHTQLSTNEILRRTKVPKYLKETILNTRKYSDSQIEEVKRCKTCNQKRISNRSQPSKKSKQIVTIREHKTKSYVIIDNLKRNRVKRSKCVTDFQPEYSNAKEAKLEMSSSKQRLHSEPKNHKSIDERAINNYELGSFFSELDVYQPNESKTNRNLISSGSYL